MNRTPLVGILVFAALVALAAASRFIDAAPNFTAVAAAALFAGFFFSSRRVAVAVPVGAMLISDCIRGFYDPRQMLVVYAMLALPVLFRSFVRGGSGSRPALWRAMGATVLCSAAFFMWTNLAVWAFGSMYTHDLAGFARCYTLAVPFFRFTLAGDLAYTGVIFGAYLLATRAIPRVARAATV
jgi:hypothetical protein